MSAVLEARSVFAGYPDSETPVLRNLSVVIEEARITALVGGSGCGKSTLVLAMAGLLQVSSGTLLLHGVEYTRASFEVMRRHRRYLQVMFQDASGMFDPRLPIGSQVARSIRALRPDWTGQQAERAQLRAQRLAGMPPELAERLISQVSGGQAKRAALARAVVAEPSVLILDEPFGGLDSEGREELAARLAAARDELGCAILFITHEGETPRVLADELVVMHDGEIVESGPAAAILARPEHPVTISWIDAWGTKNGGECVGQRREWRDAETHKCDSRP